MKKLLLKELDILGTKYDVYSQGESENVKLVDAAGISELWSKEIILDDQTYIGDKEVVDNIEDYFHKVLRHEAFHCIFHEAGHRKYSDDEKLVEALAVLYPKIVEIMEKIDNIQL